MTPDRRHDITRQTTSAPGWLPNESGPFFARAAAREGLPGIAASGLQDLDLAKSQRLGTVALEAGAARHADDDHIFKGPAPQGAGPFSFPYPYPYPSPTGPLNCVGALSFTQV